MTGAGRVLLLTDSAMAGHRAPDHPERPERADAVASGVADGAAAAGATLEREAGAVGVPAAAGRPREGGGAEPAAAEAIERVHPAAYVALLDDAARLGGGWI